MARKRYRGGSWAHIHMLRRGIRASLGAVESVIPPGGIFSYQYSDLESKSSALGGTRKGIVVDPTGTKYLVGDVSSNVVRTGTMSSAWDASTMADAHSTAEPVGDHRGNWTDGELYVTCSSSTLYYGTMSTPWDASTMGAFSSVVPLSTSSEMSDIAFSDDGLTLLVLGFRGDIHTYALTTPWDLSTLNTTRVETFDMTTISPSVWADDIGVVPVERWSWNADGTKVVTLATVSSQRILWDLSTPWDISTLAVNSWNYIGPSAAQGIHWDETAEKMITVNTSTFYVVGEETGGSGVAQAYPLSGFRQIESLNMVGSSGTVTGSALSPDGVNFYHRDTTNNRFQWYTLSTPWDFSTAVVAGEIAEDASMFSTEGMCISQDGFHMYESDANEINEWTLSTAWDVTTATKTATKVISGGGACSINADGTRMYMVNDDETIDSIDLSTPYDITTASLTTTVALSPDGGDFDELYDWTTAPNPKYHVWNLDGTRLLLISGARHVYEYDVGTAWDVTTLNYSGRSFWSKDPVSGICWKADESEIYISTTSDNVNTSAFDSRLA